MATIQVHRDQLIARPLAEVQAQFADMTHHERVGVHKALGVGNVRPGPDGCRFTGRRRMLGKMMVDEVELTRGPDGSVTLRGVEGPNAGLVIAHTFETSGDKTLVKTTVEFPVKGALRLLGPLVKLGIQRDLKLSLEEDRFDLEVRGYRPA